MNPEWDQPQGQSSKAGTPGEQMQARREALGWSIEQAAEQLKLAPRQVAAIEAGDYASLPNPAVARGFIRAYAKILKLDAAPFVAAIAITPADNADVKPARALSASFSESRFPTLTQRSSNPTGWIVGVVAVLVIAGGVAYKMGYIPPVHFMHGDQASASAVAESKPAASSEAASVVTTEVAAPATAQAPTQSTSVPLISVPSPNADATATPAAPSTTPAAPAPTSATAPAAEAPAAAKAEANPLVLTVRQDSWIEIRRKNGAPLISRIVLAGSTETFDISEPVLLVVGKPGGVDATLRGTALELHPIPGGTTARLNLK